MGQENVQAVPRIVLMGIKSARTSKSCKAAGGVWRHGVRGVRRGSCAKHPKRR